MNLCSYLGVQTLYTCLTAARFPIIFSFYGPLALPSHQHPQTHPQKSFIILIDSLVSSEFPQRSILNVAHKHSFRPFSFNLFAEPEIYQVDLFSILLNTEHDISRLDIVVNVIVLMQDRYFIDQLKRNVFYCRNCQPTVSQDH